MTQVAKPTLVVEVAFGAGANPAAWSLGNTPFPAQLGPALIDTWTDITDDVRAMTITRRRNRAVGTYDEGRLVLELDNRSRDYDPLNLSGQYVTGGVTDVRPGRRIRVLATHPTTAVQYALFTGFVRDWGLDYGKQVATTRPVATDVMTKLVRTDVALTTSAGLSGAAVAEVLAAAGIAGYQVDDGQETLQAAAFAGSARDALRTLVESEQGELYVEAGGTLHFKDRHAYLTEDRSARPQAWLGAGPFTGGIAHEYLRGLGPSLLLGLGESSGQALDDSGNGNHGTVALGTGARDATALDYGGDGAIDCAEDTLVTVPAAAAVNGIFSAGGTIVCIVTADDAGGSSVGTIWGKNVNLSTLSLRVQSLSGGALALRFDIGFATTNGAWTTTGRPLVVGNKTAVAVSFDASSVSNDPTITLVDLVTGTVTTLTVGSGLSESQTPVGTAADDSAYDFLVGNNAGLSRGFDGKVDELAVFKGAPLTAAQILEWATRAQTGIPGSVVDFSDPDCVMDVDELVNSASVTRTGGAAQAAVDSTSIADYGKHSDSRSGLAVASDARALTLAQYLVAKRKDPAVRIRSVTMAPQKSAEHMTQALSRRLRDRVTVQFMPVGGVAIQQDVFVTGIEHEFTPASTRTRFYFDPTDKATGWRLGFGQFGATGARATALAL